jgi:hypothetical protein
VPKFPDPPPPSELARIGPELRIVARGTLLWRVYFRGGPFPSQWNELRSFGPTGSRFDHQTLPKRVQARAVLYAAEHGPTCIAEVFQETRVIDRTDRAPWLVAFRLARDITVLDTTGAWPTRAGASTALHSGARTRARHWAQAIYEAYPNVEGILYCSSMDANRPAHAVWERAASALPASPEFHRALADPAIQPELEGAALRFNYAIV